MTVEAADETDQVDAENADQSQQAQPPEPPAEQPERRVVSMPSDAIARIRREEREKGRKAQLAQLDEDARKMGWKSHAQMVEAAARLRSTEEGTDDEDTEESQASSRTRQGEQPRKRRGESQKDYEERMERLKEDRRRANRARARSDRRARHLERQLSSQKAENELRIAAVRAGVKDIDYALHMLRRDLSKQSEADLAKFDEDKFFRETLRKSHPYLYEATAEPAQTGPASDGAPPPDSKTVEQEVADSKKVDATKMSREDYEKHLRQKGLQVPSNAF